MARSEPGVKPLGVISIIRGLGLVGEFPLARRLG